ncbi:hypothetical protein D1872_338650 [compost metagenome]
MGLQKLIGDIKLRIHQTEDGSVAIVEVNEVEDLFDKTHKLFPSYTKGNLHGQRGTVWHPNGGVQAGFAFDKRGQAALAFPTA